MRDLIQGGGFVMLSYYGLVKVLRVEAPKVGYKRYRTVHAWWGKGDRLAMLADAQACQHNSTVHMQRFFPPKVQKQITVMSLDDVTDGLLTYIGGRDKRKCA